MLSPPPRPRRGSVEWIGLNRLDWDGPEREETRKQIENFGAHQQRFVRERSVCGVEAGQAADILRSLPLTAARS